MRNLFRAGALNIASAANAVQNQISPNTASSVVIVLLHHVRPDEEQQFIAFLSWLNTNYKVVSYSTAVEQIKSGTINRPTAAISFDDGLTNNLAAARIMQEHDVSGCFFVCPGIVGETDPVKIHTFCRERMLFQSPETFMNWDDLETLMDMGHEVGNHSQSHLYMMKLEDEVFFEQVASARDEIQSRLGQVSHFAWPYGRFFHFRHHQIRQTLSLGHASCASGERGAHAAHISSSPASDSVMCLRRESISMSWPLRHCQYFLSKSSRTPLSIENTAPTHSFCSLKRIPKNRTRLQSAESDTK